MASGDDETPWIEFNDTVNMTAAELEKWLRTDQSKPVGQKSHLAFSGGLDQARNCIVALGANLLLNAGWSWLFFRYHKLGASALGAAALTVSSADLARRTAHADPRAGLALLPYPLWCAFATILSTHIWQLNRRSE